MPDDVLCPICKQGAVRYSEIQHAVYFRCPSCATIFQNPVPKIADMKEYANSEYTQGLYKAYLQARELKYATFRERVRHMRARSQGGRLLDVGCASGFLIDIALASGFDAYGIDFSEAAVQAASEQAAPRIRVADVNEIEATSGRPFDVVTAFDIVEHTLDPMEFIRGLRACLVPGGLLVVTTPDTRHFLRYLMGSRWPMLQPYQHTVLFSRKSMGLALEAGGFEDLSFSSARKVLTPDYLMAQVEGYLPLLASTYRALTFALPARLRRTAIPVGIGEMMVFARRAVGPDV